MLKVLKWFVCIDCNINSIYRFIAADMRSQLATSLAYKTISASITDMWAFFKSKKKIYNHCANLFFIIYLQFEVGWFVLKQSLSTAYLDFRLLECLFLSMFVILTSDLNFGNSDPNTNLTMFGSKLMHSPIQQQSEIL